MPEDKPDETEADLEALPPGTRARGASVIVAAVALVFTIVWLLSGGGSEFFARKIDTHTFLSDTGGLSKGADVLLSGVQIGEVINVHLSNSADPNRAIQVDMRLKQKYASRIPVDSIAALTADNLLGDKYVNITLGKATSNITDGAEIPSLIQTGSFNPADMVASLKATLQRVDAILTEIQQGNTPLAQFVNGNDLYTKVLAQVDAIHQGIRSIAGPKTAMGQMLFRDASYNQIRQPILNADHQLEEIQRGENAAGKLFTTSTAYDNALAEVRSLHKSISDLDSGKSGSNDLLKSDAQYRKLQAQLQSINQTLDQLTTGNGKVAQLMQSAQLYESLEVKSRTTGTFLREFRENPRKFLRIKPFGSKHPKKP